MNPNLAASVRARLLNVAKTQGSGLALLGMTNSRVKDYFDLSVLLERETLDADLLAQAIKATFDRRGMTVPAELPGRPRFHADLHGDIDDDTVLRLLR